MKSNNWKRFASLVIFIPFLSGCAGYFQRPSEQEQTLQTGCLMPEPSGRPWKVKVKRLGKDLFNGISAFKHTEAGYSFIILEPGGVTLLEGAIDEKDGSIQWIKGIKRITETLFPEIFASSLYKIYRMEGEVLINRDHSWEKRLFSLGIFNTTSIYYLPDSANKCVEVTVDNPWYSADIILSRF